MITDLLPLPLVPEHKPHLAQLLLNPISLDAGQLTNSGIAIGDATNDLKPIFLAFCS